MNRWSKIKSDFLNKHIIGCSYSTFSCVKFHYSCIIMHEYSCLIGVYFARSILYCTWSKHLLRVLIRVKNHEGMVSNIYIIVFIIPYNSNTNPIKYRIDMKPTLTHEIQTSESFYVSFFNIYFYILNYLIINSNPLWSSWFSSVWSAADFDASSAVM